MNPRVFSRMLVLQLDCIASLGVVNFLRHLVSCLRLQDCVVDAVL